MWKKVASLLGILVLVAAIVTPVSALSASLEDTAAYTGAKTWYSPTTYFNRYENTIKGGYVQNVKVRIPWDDYVVTSVAVLTHSLVLYTDDGKTLKYIGAIGGATDYNRGGTYTSIKLPGVTGWERYSVSFPSNGESKHYVYAGPTGGTETASVRVIVSATDEASAKVAAEAKVKAGLELLGSGVENSISLSAEVVERISQTNEFVVEVSFTQSQYRFELGYKGYLIHELTEKCYGFCPTSERLGPEGLPSNTYTKIETKPFDLSYVEFFWSFPPDGVDYNSLGTGELPIVYEEVKE